MTDPKPKANPNNPNVVRFLKEKLEELRVRKGRFSIIAKTLEHALRSGTDEDLRRGRIAFEIYQQKGEQRRLDQIPRSQKPSLTIRREFTRG